MQRKKNGKKTENWQFNTRENWTRGGDLEVKIASWDIWKSHIYLVVIESFVKIISKVVDKFTDVCLYADNPAPALIFWKE